MSRLNPFAPEWKPQASSHPPATGSLDTGDGAEAPAFDLAGLPSEVITTVVSFLTAPSDLANCVLAGKIFEHAAKESELCVDGRGLRAVAVLGVAGACEDVASYRARALLGLRKYMPGTVALLLPNVPLEDSDVGELVAALPRLQLLDVSGGRKLTQAGVAALVSRTSPPAAAGRPAPPLRVINLQRCFQLHSGSLDTLLAAPGLACLALSHLDLGRWGLDAATNPAIAAIAVGATEPPSVPQPTRPPDLQALVLHNCLRLHGPAIAALASAVPGARFLMLGGSTLALASFVNPAVPPPPLPPAAAELLVAAYKPVLTSTAATVAAHMGAATALVAAALAMPRLVALELTSFPLPLVAAVRRVLADAEALGSSGRAPVEVWDFATDASAVEVARRKLRRYLRVSEGTPAWEADAEEEAASEVLSSVAAASTAAAVAAAAGGLGAGACSAVGRVTDLLNEQAVASVLRCSVNCSSVSRSTPLHVAACSGNTRGVAGLLAAGASVDARDTGGATALFLASEQGHTQVCAALLAAGADPTISNAAGESPMYIAALRGHLGCVQALLGECTARGIEWMDPELYGDSWTPLHAAAVANRADVAACLLQAAGASGGELVVAPNKYGQSVVHIAARKGSSQLLRMLLSAGGAAAVGSRDGSGDTPVDVAKKNRHVAALAEFRRLTAMA